jgi:O-antigen/teichoic acid export membrane protein
MIHKLKNGHWPVFLLSSLSSIGNLFLPIILVRLLSPDDIGIYKIFFLHLGAIPFLFMTGGPMHSVFYWAGRKAEERGRYLNATWALTLFLSALVLIVGFPLKDLIANHLDIPHQYVVILLITGALYSPTGHYTESSIALGKHMGSVFDTVVELLKSVGFIFIAWKYKDLTALFIFFAAFMAIKLLIMIYLNKKQNDIGLETDKAHLSRVFMYALPMSISGLLGFFVDKVDMLLLSSHLDASSFAYYSLGCLAVPPLYLLEMSVQKVLIPSISKTYLTHESSEGSAAFRKAVKDISFLIIPSIFGLITFATPIVRMLYTEQYLESVPYLQIFAISYLLLMFPHDTVARATGNTSWILKMYLIITPISLVGAYYAANHYGAQAVLIITILIKFVPKVLGLKLSKQLMNWQWSEMFPIKHLMLFSGICLLLSIGCLLMKGLFVNDIVWFLVCGGAFGVIYLAVANYLGNRGKYVQA